MRELIVDLDDDTDLQFEVLEDKAVELIREGILVDKSSHLELRQTSYFHDEVVKILDAIQGA